MMFGSLLRQSSLLRYLPAYFDFVDDSVQQQRERSPKAEKRQRTEEKLTSFAKLLRPQNEADSEDNEEGGGAAAALDPANQHAHEEVKM